jgi:hypothetical protein
LCQRATQRLYTQALADRPGGVSLQPTREAIAQLESAAGAAAYFGGMPPVQRAIPIAEPAADGATPDALAAARQTVLDGEKGYRDALLSLVKTRGRLQELAELRMLVRAGVQVKPRALGLECVDVESISEAIAEDERAQEPLLSQAVRFEAALGRRLGLAFSILRADAFRDRLGQVAGLRDEVDRLLPAERALGDVLPQVWEVASSVRLLGCLWSVAQKLDDEPKGMLREFEGRTRKLREMLHAIRKRTSEVADPFSSGTDRTIGRSVFAGAMSLEPGPDQVSSAMTVVDRLLAVNRAVLERLGSIAARVEAACGLPALPVPAGRPDGQPQPSEAHAA